MLTTTNSTNTIYYISSRTLAITKGPSNDKESVRFWGYVAETDVNKAAQIVRDAILRQEDGICADKYSGVPDHEIHCSNQSYMANQLVSQTEVQLPIGFVYPGIGILSSNQAYNVIIRMSNASSSRTLIQLKDKTSQAKVTNRNPAVTVLREAERREFLKNPNVESNLVDTMLNQLFWLHVKMPERFPFTCIVMLNSTAQGLLHSLIRHYESWCDKSKNLHRMLLTLSDYSVIHADILEISTANADRVTPLLDAFDNVVLPTTWRG